MKCPKCNGELQYQEEVSGSFIHEINADGTFDEYEKEFYGDTWKHVICKKCNEEFEYEIDYSGDDPKIELL